MQYISNEGLPHPTIGVGAVVFNERGNVLLIRRNKSPAMGLWSVPGGCHEPGESLADACQREIREETGLEIRVKQIIAVVERRFVDYHYVIIDFLADLTDTSNVLPIASSDVSAAAWVSLDDLQNYDLVEGLREIINNAAMASNQSNTPGLQDLQGKNTDYITPA